jgi:hypothetical protein
MLVKRLSSTRLSFTLPAPTLLRSNRNRLVRCRPMQVLVIAMACALSACSPDLDWREFSVPLPVPSNGAENFRAMLPGRYSEESRNLPDGGRMQWWSAKARDCIFGIGLTELPDDDPMALARTTAYLAANIGSQAQVLQQGDGSNGTQTTSGTLTRDIAVTGQAGQQAVALRGRLVLRGRQLLQAVVIMPMGADGESAGAATRLTEAEIEHFLGGLRLQNTATAPAASTASK